ncbi:PREDICTED: uncharacterized protein LOC105143059 isoform X2 [Acromyrmex echinatior]|nr:PREDICTED: uncharacterized protein LOC105143059 isoform X2 [Acromyrmex echinatior]
MLYMQDPRDDDGHFAWIKNLSCFVRSQITRDKKKKFFCNRKMNDCAIRLPSVDKWLEFGNHCNKERVSFIVYADLECVLRKTKSIREDAWSYTYQQHEALIGYYVR